MGTHCFGSKVHNRGHHLKKMTWTFIDRRNLYVWIDKLRWKLFQLSVPNPTWERNRDRDEDWYGEAKGERKNEYKEEPNSPVMERVRWEWKVSPTRASVPAVRAWAHVPALAVPSQQAVSNVMWVVRARKAELSRRQRPETSKKHRETLTISKLPEKDHRYELKKKKKNLIKDPHLKRQPTSS